MVAECVDDDYRSCRHTMEDSGGGMLKLIDGRTDRTQDGGVGIKSEGVHTHTQHTVNPDVGLAVGLDQ